MTPYYSDDAVTIYHGRWEDVLPGLADVDLIVTSPPYNMGVSPGGNGRGLYRTSKSAKGKRFHDGYDTHDDRMDPVEYDRWQRGFITCALDVARLGMFYVNRPRVEHGRLVMPLHGAYDGLPLRQVIIWDRGTGIDVNLRHFCTRQEWIMLFANPDFELIDHSTSGMGDIWRLGMETEETGHPAPFPASLPQRCLLATAAATVCDPHAGSGSTLRAAKDLGRKAIGIDVSERYCEIAARRCAQEVLDLGASA